MEVIGTLRADLLGVRQAMLTDIAAVSESVDGLIEQARADRPGYSADSRAATSFSKSAAPGSPCRRRRSADSRLRRGSAKALENLLADLLELTLRSRAVEDASTSSTSRSIDDPETGRSARAAAIPAASLAAENGSSRPFLFRTIVAVRAARRW